MVSFESNLICMRDSIINWSNWFNIATWVFCSVWIGKTGKLQLKLTYVYINGASKSLVCGPTLENIQCMYCCILAIFMLEHLGFYFDNKYLCNATYSSNCALQEHQCNSLIVLELGEYKTGLTVSWWIRLKL